MYTSIGLGAAPAAACRVPSDPGGWITPAGFAAMVQQILASAAQPYWNLPVPAPYETEVLNWVVNYGYVDGRKAGACQLQVAGDMSIYNGKEWQGWFQSACQIAGAGDACGRVAAEAAQFNLPFATWLKSAAANANGVVLASRPTPGSWTVQEAYFVAPSIDDDPVMALLASVPPQLQAPAKAYLAATKAVLMAKQGKFGAARDLFVVYAPSLANLGVAVNGFGETFTLPPMPQVQISYPDGSGGAITIGTANPPNPNAPPRGAPPVKKPEEAGLPSEKLMMWTQLIGTGLGIVVGGTTLYFMLRNRRKK
jgi:hypothetical protein